MKEIKTIPLFQANIGDLMEAMREVLNLFTDNTKDGLSKCRCSDRKFAYGIKGLAQILGCSTATAQRIKSTGRLDKAISQDGRIIVVDVELALELMKQK